MLKEAIRRWLPERMIGAIQLAAHWAGRSAGERLTGMTSIGEQQFYTECANGLSHVDGVVVDLGCWMCSTAISLARGIRRQGGRPPHARRIYAIDRFIWDPWMDPWLSEVRGKYRPGDSFLPEALRRIGEYRDVIELVQADLTEYSWQHGPIKILLVDAMKSWQLARSITTSFYPSLVKGSVLIHQDFRDPHTPWIHILQYRLRDHFNLRHDVVDGWTTAFETVRQVPAEVADSATMFDGISDAEVEEAIGYSMACVHDEGKADIAAAHLMYFIYRDRTEKAREALARYSGPGMRPTKNFSTARERVESAQG